MVWRDKEGTNDSMNGGKDISISVKPTILVPLDQWMPLDGIDFPALC